MKEGDEAKEWQGEKGWREKEQTERRGIREEVSFYLPATPSTPASTL